MTNGICPKCTAAEIYTFVDMGYQRDLVVAFWTRAKLTYYVCTHCGYVEQYILDEQKLEKVRQNREYVHPQEAA